MWAGYHSHLSGKGYALEGARTRIGAIHEKEVTKAFTQVDRAPQQGIDYEIENRIEDLRRS